MLTNQEIFDGTMKHLRTQNCKSVDPANSSRCLYRGSNNTKCAVGYWIPDELYDPKMEDSSARHLIDMEWIPKMDKSHKSLASSLQYIHDGYPVMDWEERFQIVAREFNLKYTPKEETSE